MENFVKQIGLKGIGIFLVTFILSDFLENLIMYGSIIGKCLSIILLSMFIDTCYREYVNNMHEKIDESLSKMLHEFYQYGQKINNDIININLKFDNISKQINDDRDDIINSVLADNEYKINNLRDYLLNIIVLNCKNVIDANQKKIQNLAELYQKETQGIVKELHSIDDNASRCISNVINISERNSKEIISFVGSSTDKLQQIYTGNAEKIEDSIVQLYKQSNENKEKFIEKLNLTNKEFNNLSIEIMEIKKLDKNNSEKLSKELNNLSIEMMEIKKLDMDNNEQLSKDINTSVNAIVEKVDSLRDEYASFSNALNENLDMAFDVNNNNIEALRDALENVLKINNFSDNASNAENKPEKLSKEVIQESISNKETDTVVLNTIVNGITVRSEMFENNNLSLIAGYKDGRIVYDKIFDMEGNLQQENTYNFDGELKQRNIYFRKGNEITVETESF